LRAGRLEVSSVVSKEYSGSSTGHPTRGRLRVLDRPFDGISQTSSPILQAEQTECFGSFRRPRVIGIWFEYSFWKHPLEPPDLNSVLA